MTDSAHRDVEALARNFHETYERLAPDHGYETRKESAVPWEDVPAQNKGLMIAVVAEVTAPLLARLEQVEQERDDALRQRDHDYARFKSIKGSLIESDSRVIVAEARVQELEAALREIVRRDATSDYSNIYAVSTEYAGVARRALAPDTAEER